MGLPLVVHIQLVLNVDPLDRDPRGRDDGTGLPAGGTHPPFERRGVETVEHDIECLHHVVPQVGKHAAERRGDAGESRHQRSLQSDLANQCAGMQRAAAAEWHGYEARSIVVALDGDQANRPGHAGVGDLHDRSRRRDGVEAERRADVRRNGKLGRLDIE